LSPADDVAVAWAGASDEAAAAGLDPLWLEGSPVSA